MSRPLMSVSPEAMRALEEYDWPGNVREMQNIIERTIALSDTDRIEKKDLPPDIGGGEEETTPVASYNLVVGEQGIDLPGAINAIETRLIRDAMELAGGVKARAAALLGINRTTLVEKIKRLGPGSE
jgi:DNA-binding NtrC family response regulator